MELLRQEVDRSITIETSEDSTAYPAASRYALALSRNRDRVTSKQLAMLNAHRAAPGRIMSEEGLTEISKCKRWSVARSQYALLGRMLGESMLFEPLKSNKNSPEWIRMVAFEVDSKNGEQIEWQLRAELAEALDSVDL